MGYGYRYGIYVKLLYLLIWHSVGLGTLKVNQKNVVMVKV